MPTRNKNSLLKAIALILCILTTGIPAAHAQETLSSITGRVVDTNGASVPNVRITVTNDDTRLQREATTNLDGLFVVPLLPAGIYTLTAAMSGFATVTVTDVPLRVSINATVDVILQPGEIVETVNVEAEANQVDATNATLKYSVTNKEVSGFPVLTTVTGRNVLTLLPFLIPGVFPTDVLGTARNSNTSGATMSINGARPVSNSFNFEGADDNDPLYNESAATLPNPDTLREFTVLTNGYQADQGRSSGGIVNAVVKSGTEQLHGNLRYFVVNEAFNARGFFDPEVPINRLNTFGGQLGGPVRIPKLYDPRGRTFFFFDYEGTRSRKGRVVDITVPTEKQRRGDFSDLPIFQRPVDPQTGGPFPGGVIPMNRLNPISLAYLKRFIPLPNHGGNSFIVERSTDFLSDQYALRVDHRIGSGDNLYVTVYRNSSVNTLVNPSLFPITQRGDNPQNSWSVIVSETHTLSPRVVNQFTGAFTNFNISSITTGEGLTGVDPSVLGFTGIHPQTEKFLAVPSVIVIGTGVRVEPRIPFLNLQIFHRAWQFRDDLSYTRGNHSFKFGADVHSFLVNEFRGNNNGSFTFSNTTAGGSRNALGNFLLGIPNQFVQDSGASIFPRQKAYYFYAMDDWRIRPNLTINLGLRYELSPPFKDKLGQGSVFRPGEQSTIFPQAPLGLLFPGDSDPVLGIVPRSLYPTDKNNLAPRLGIAYSPRPKSGWLRKLFGDGKTAIRAAWGVYYDSTIGTNFENIVFTQPFSVSLRLTASQIRRAGGTFANPFGSSPNPFPLGFGNRIFSGLPQIQPIDPTFRTAYTYQYNFTIQRELPWSLLMEIAYVGTNSFKLNRERELNLGQLTPDATPDNFQERRLFPQFGDIPSQESTGRARYDSAQFRLSRRLRSGLTFDVSYVFSKALDNGSFPNGDFSAGPNRWARSAFDRRHNFVMSYTYELPATRRKGIVGGLLNGWQIGGITQMRSGLPLDIQQQLDPTLTTLTFSSGIPDFVGPYVRLDPRRFQTIIFNGVPVSGNFFFDPNAFRAVEVSDASQARPGTLGRNVFDGPGLQLWDLTVIKRIKIHESQSIEFRTDIRNLFNRPLFDVPDTFVPSSDFEFSQFGMVTSSGIGVGGRTMQFSLRYSF